MSRPLSVALIVEDEVRFRDFLVEVVQGLGFEAVAAGSAPAARKAIGDRGVDLLLLDLNLPVVEGLEFLEEFRESRPDVPVIIITGFGDLGSAQRAIRLGVSDFLSKPCDMGQLEAAIGKARRDLVPREAVPVEVGSSARSTLCLAEVERDVVLEALERCGGNRSDAARKLGISRRALYNKIDEYRKLGISVP